jgi:hypothetical protein
VLMFSRCAARHLVMRRAQAPISSLQRRASRPVFLQGLGVRTARQSPGVVRRPGLLPDCPSRGRAVTFWAANTYRPRRLGKMTATARSPCAQFPVTSATRLAVPQLELGAQSPQDSDCAWPRRFRPPVPAPGSRCSVAEKEAASGVRARARYREWGAKDEIFYFGHVAQFHCGSAVLRALVAVQR